MDYEDAFLRQDNHDGTNAAEVVADDGAVAVDAAVDSDVSRVPSIVPGRTKPPPARAHSVNGVIAALISSLRHSMIVPTVKSML